MYLYPQPTGHGRYRFHQGINKKYIYLIIYFTTIIKPPYEQALVGMGWITDGPRRHMSPVPEKQKRKEKDPGHECLLGPPCHCHCWGWGRNPPHEQLLMVVGVAKRTKKEKEKTIPPSHICSEVGPCHHAVIIPAVLSLCHGFNCALSCHRPPPFVSTPQAVARRHGCH